MKISVGAGRGLGQLRADPLDDGDKWSLILMYELRGGPRRVNDLRRAAAPITQRMLSSSLQGLERDGLVIRTVYPTVPPRVEYVLTDAGLALNETVQHVVTWADRHGDSVLSACAAYAGSRATAASLSS